MRANEFVHTPTLDENWKNKLAAAAVAGATMSGVAGQTIMPGDQPKIEISQDPPVEVVKNANGVNIMNVEGKPYQMVFVTDPSQVPLGIKIRVSQAQMRERGIGSYDVVLRGNNAYIIKAQRP